MGYLLNIIIMGGIFSILAVSLNIACGFTGILSLAHAAFYGVGAYTVAILTKQWGVPFLIAFLVGGGMAICFSVGLGVPTLRLKGDYLLIATLGFGEIFTNLLTNADSVTNGPRGISGILPASIAGLRFDSDFSFLLLLLFVLLLCVVTTTFLKHSPLGQVFFGIAEDEDGMVALGRNTTYFKILSLCISSFWAGLAGGLYAAYIGYISPSLFTINESILIFTMVLLGGLGNIQGSIIGALLLIAIPEAMRFAGLPGVVAANVRQVLYGAILILIMYFRSLGAHEKAGAP